MGRPYTLKQYLQYLYYLSHNLPKIQCLLKWLRISTLNCTARFDIVMLFKVLQLLAAATAGTAMSIGRKGNLLDHEGSVLLKRAISLDPIDTSPVQGISGGQVANNLPPLNSFVDGLKPPVRKTYCFS
jgi:hypothetical protein